MKVLFCGGGTAGHINPAIAMAQLLLKEYEGCEVAFVGRRGGRENDLITDLGYKLYTIELSGLKRSLSIKNLKALCQAISGTKKAKKIIEEFNPDIVIGTGGYVCWPVLRAATEKKIKTLIHESNAYPGLATRRLAYKCDRVLLNFEKAKEHLKRKDNVTIVGNPIREGFKKGTREEERARLGLTKKDILIVSFGGSLGAEKINLAVLGAMKNYICEKKNIHHIHSSGYGYYDKIKAEHPELCKGKNGCLILPYIKNAPSLLQAADITITRSGSATLSELAAVGSASILIPSPNVTANHQYENARALQEQGAAVIINENSLTQDSLTEAIAELVTNKDKAMRMRTKIKKFSNGDTDDKILAVINSCIKKKD